MEPISAEQLSELDRLINQDPNRALELLNLYEQQYSGDANFESNSGGLYIDLGTFLLRRDLVELGIRQIETTINTSSQESRPNLLYNLGNGYHTLQTLDLQQGGYHFDPDSTPLEKAKFWYRRALARRPELDAGLECHLWVNYGNCLSSLGRIAEAIDAYDRALRLNPHHAMAIGNLGMELVRFAHAAQRGIFLFDAVEMLDKALAIREFGECGGREQARAIFEESRQQAVLMIERMGLKRAETRDELRPKQESPVDDYIEFCAERGLFLNFCLQCRKCESYAKDGFALSLVTGVKEQSRPIRLFRMVNEIREAYAFARFQFFQSQHPLVDTVLIDKMTPYVDNLDYAVYGTRVAALKSAFEGAYGVFDKIAYFLSEYLGLGIDRENRIAFTTIGRIWSERDGGPLRPQLRDLNNSFLFALYGVARDFDVNLDDPDRDGYCGRLRRTRNRLSHEYVIPHVEFMHWETDADKPDCHILYPNLVEQTLQLLQLLKASVIYLVSFIRQEESRRHHPTKAGRTFERETEPYDPDMYGATLDF